MLINHIPSSQKDDLKKLIERENNNLWHKFTIENLWTQFLPQSLHGWLSGEKKIVELCESDKQMFIVSYVNVVAKAQKL